MSEKICVLGDGNFGTAIAQLLAQNGHSVQLWCNNSEIALSLNQNNINSVYLPDIKLNSKIKAFTDLQEAMNGCKIVFEAIPVKYLRAVLQNVKNFYKLEQIFVVLSKGIEQETFLLPSQVIEQVLECNVAVLLGPSFAHDLLQNKLTAVNLFSTNDVVFNEIKAILENEFFKIQQCDDPIGMQICAAFKNVIAIAIGILDAKNCSDNTKAYIFTKAINELAQLTSAMNGKKDTVFTLAGIGDLILTCFGQHSKNFQLGFQLGKGQSLENIMASNKTVPEGINTLKVFNVLLESKNINLPLFKNIYTIVFEGRDIDVLFNC